MRFSLSHADIGCGSNILVNQSVDPRLFGTELEIGQPGGPWWMCCHLEGRGLVEDAIDELEVLARVPMDVIPWVMEPRSLAVRSCQMELLRASGVKQAVT